MPSDRDLAQQYPEELVELVVRALFRAHYGHDTETPISDFPESSPFLLQARAVAAALSSAGRLVPEGSEVGEEWGTRVAFPDGVTFDHWAGTRERAEGGVSPRECTRTLLRRTAITTPWTPVEPAQRSGVAAQEKP